MTKARTRPPAAPRSASVAPDVIVHPENSNVTACFEYVTPDLARKYLDTCPTWQRPSSGKTEDQYTSDMLGGDWPFTGDPFRFTDAGELMDGQHRCYAIEQSGQPQWVLVIRGLGRDVMRVLDTGYQRLFTNYLHTLKEPPDYVGSTASLTGKILDWQRGNYATSAVARQANARHLSAKKSMPSLIHTFDTWRPQIAASIKEGKAIRRAFPGSAPDTTFAFAHFYLSQLDVFLANAFFTELTQQSNSTDPTYPIRALEKTLVARARDKDVKDWTWLSWMFRTWNHWLTYVHWNDGQTPEPLKKEQFRTMRRPRFDLLVMPDDPHEEDREEGWEPL